MNNEFGIFSDEGLIERGFYSYLEAQGVLNRDYADCDCEVAVVCSEHPDQREAFCEDCDSCDCDY